MLLEELACFRSALLCYWKSCLSLLSSFFISPLLPLFDSLSRSRLVLGASDQLCYATGTVVAALLCYWKCWLVLGGIDHCYATGRVDLFRVHSICVAGAF